MALLKARAFNCMMALRLMYEDVRAIWEERFQRKYGFWRGFVDQVVDRYLDCGVEEAGFARLKCDTCGAETLLVRRSRPHPDPRAAQT